MESILGASPTVSLFRHQTMQTVHTNLWIALWMNLKLLKSVVTYSAEMLMQMYRFTHKSE